MLYEAVWPDGTSAKWWCPEVYYDYDFAETTDPRDLCNHRLLFWFQNKLLGRLSGVVNFVASVSVDRRLATAPSFILC